MEARPMTTNLRRAETQRIKMRKLAEGNPKE